MIYPSGTRSATRLRVARTPRTPGAAGGGDDESQSGSASEDGGAVPARQTRAVVATPSFMVHVPSSGVSLTRPVAAFSMLDKPASLTSDPSMCVECVVRKANSNCSKNCCRSCCIAVMARTGVPCAEHTKDRARLERMTSQIAQQADSAVSAASQPFVTAVHGSTAVTSAMTHVAAVVARLHGPLLDPLGPYVAALNDAHTRSDPVIDAAALSVGARTTTACPSCHKQVAVHGGNFWTHLYVCDRAALAPHLQIAFDRARTSHVAPNSALPLPPHDAVSEQARDAIANALPLDVVRSSAARRTAENEALLGSLFGGAAAVPSASESGEAGWKRIESRVAAFDDGAHLEQTVRASEDEAHLYASAIRDINECSTAADVEQCRAKLKREWASAFKDDVKRRRTRQLPAAAQKLVTI